MTPSVEQSFALAAERYAEVGVDVRGAIERLQSIAISVHCWQGDDVRGFESSDSALGGGLAVTGNYRGRARTVDQLRSDLEFAYALVPGKHRLNLHAIYGEFAAPVDRNAVGVEHFRGWIDWAAGQGVKLDFNPSFFAHPLASDGFTLAHADAGVRQFWIEHGKASRAIAAAMGQAQGSPCVNNVWIPDGMKDLPANRLAPRERLAAALDEVFAHEYAADTLRDAVESKLFGIGSESYVVGSHEFYLGYAISRKKMLCLDSGHFHPTETVSDKLHVSRGVRWDSDHVVTYSDELQAVMQEVVRGNFIDRVAIGLDFFDASINRVAAWAIGIRNTLKALLAALLEPTGHLQQLEADGDYTSRLALLEEQKTMPLGAVWDYYCELSGAPRASEWLARVKEYETRVLAARDS
jgi:L-rhamnose isomerase